MQQTGIPQAFSAEIERLMRSPPVLSSQPGEALEFAREYGGLLIGWSWSFTALRPSGDVVDWDPPSKPTVTHSYSAFLQALGHASEIYPTLEAFIPSRPDHAVDCHFCHGTGEVISTAIRPKRCPMCGGLQWLTGDD